MKVMRIITAIATALVLSACDKQAAQPDEQAMAAASGVYKSCAACHGAAGEGNAALNAPALVNLDLDYMRRQLVNFKDGLRGAHPDDVNGQMMAAQAAMLQDDAQIDALVAQIDGFEDVLPPVTLDEDTENGQQVYEMICGACHGVEGVGNPALNAPSLRGIDDWYLAGQYESFRNGWRGTHQQDIPGQQMQRMGHVISQQEAENVAVYLLNLGLDD